jgi:hypothetical protein
MALVGVIEPGTVDRIIHSVVFAKADVLILFAQDHRFGHIVFTRGVVETALLDDMDGDDAVATLRGWSGGHFTLIKRNQLEEGREQTPAVLCGLPQEASVGLERWLKHKGYSTSVVAYPQHAEQLISFLKPELILTACPRQFLGISCVELKDWASMTGASSHVIAVGVAEGACTEPRSACLRISGVEELEEVLSQQPQGDVAPRDEAAGGEPATAEQPTSEQPDEEETLSPRFASLLDVAPRTASDADGAPRAGEGAAAAAVSAVFVEPGRKSQSGVVWIVVPLLALVVGALVWFFFLRDAKDGAVHAGREPKVQPKVGLQAGSAGSSVAPAADASASAMKPSPSPDAGASIATPEPKPRPKRRIEKHGVQPKSKTKSKSETPTKPVLGEGTVGFD